MNLRHQAVAIVGAAIVAVTGTVFVTPTASAATPPTIAVGDVTVPEGNAGTTPARLIVRLSNPVATTTVARFVTTGGTATAGADYRKRSGAVRIRAGQTSGVIAIRVFGDTSAEASETVGVRLTNTGGLSSPDAQGAVTIRDDEGIAGLAIGDAAVWEGDTATGLAKLTVTLATAVGQDTVVRYTTADSTAHAPGDYRMRTAKVTIRAGARSTTITPTIYGDGVLENDEVFTVSLTGATGVIISDAAGTVTIRNDEPVPPPPPPPPPPPATPGAPADLTVEPGPLPRYLTATWSAPTSSLPITGYDLEVTRTTTNVVANVTAPFTFGCGLGEITDTCVMRVRARNASGDGAWSAPVTTSTWSAPAAPPNLTVNFGGGSVSWDAPASDRPIIQYQVQKQANGATSWTHVETTTHLHASTTCGFCSVRVSAQSDVGLGQWSTVAIALPGAPTGLTATRDASNHEFVHITWSPPTDPGSHPITSYDVFVNGFPLTPTTSTGVDEFMRSTLTWQIQVYTSSLIGRSLMSASFTLPPG